MNCTRCNAALPDNVSFCSQCGNSTNSPIFPPEPPEHQPKNTGLFILFGCVGCGCLVGALIALMFVVSTLFWVRQPEIVRPPFNASVTDTIGSEFNLYGKTIDNEDFDWESLRGKYVLVKFTATWCGSCKMEIPGMREAYKKYHDKGLEIVSVYISEPKDNAETIKRYVESEQLPWIILSEPLTKRAGLPPQGESFGIQSVPTMLLVDKEGKILATETRGERLQQELKKLFGE